MKHGSARINAKQVNLFVLSVPIRVSSVAHSFEPKSVAISPIVDVGSARAVIQQMLREVLPHSLGEVRLIVRVAVGLARHDEEVEAFVGLDQGIDQANRVGGMD